jgi:hypothetical protein
MGELSGDAYTQGGFAIMPYVPAPVIGKLGIYGRCSHLKVSAKRYKFIFESSILISIFTLFVLGWAEIITSSNLRPSLLMILLFMGAGYLCYNVLYREPYYFNSNSRWFKYFYITELFFFSMFMLLIIIAIAE